MIEAAAAHPGTRGYVFYHRQDLESAVAGDGLAFAYAAVGGVDLTPREETPETRAGIERFHIVDREENVVVSNADEDRRSRNAAIGAALAKALGAHGVPVEWGGSPSMRVVAPPFPWQKRRTTEAPDVSSRVAPQAPPFAVDAEGRCVACAGKGWKIVTAGSFPEVCTACKGKGRFKEG